MPTNSALFTDQYELVMAYGYWQLGMAEHESVFYLTYRNNPFNGDYVVTCGLNSIIDYLNNYRFTAQDIDYLADLTDPSGTPLFPKEFLVYLRKLKFTCDVDAIPEGTLVFPHEPLLRVKGPLLQCQLLETLLINHINFPSLIATKASRVYHAAQGDSVVEFGVRRAQGPDGGISSSRAAYIGGCDSTSNVLAGQLFDIPIKGTQAHSWIMAFDDELTAFRSFANLLGENTTLLVDTYHTIEGVKNAITVGNELRQNNKDLAAIRLDSGDLVSLSQQSRKMLDEAGFTNTKIFASGDLDEKAIKSLKDKGAKINAWGVGTKLSTAYDQPSLNTIYKLCAIRNPSGEWDYKLKISDQADKTTMAGIIQVRRYGELSYDVLYDADQKHPVIPAEAGINYNDSRNSVIPAKAGINYIDLLVPIFRNGKQVYDTPSIHTIRENVIKQVALFYEKANKPYPVKIDPQLTQLQVSLGADVPDNA